MIPGLVTSTCYKQKEKKQKTKKKKQKKKTTRRALQAEGTEKIQPGGECAKNSKAASEARTEGDRGSEEQRRQSEVIRGQVIQGLMKTSDLGFYSE